MSLIIKEPVNTGAIEIVAKKNDETSLLDKPIGGRFLIKFASATIGSMIMSSAFGIIDGVFAARFISSDSLAAVGVVWPVLAMTLALTFMISVGGAALVGKKIGENKFQEAREDFTALNIVNFCVLLVICISAMLFSHHLLEFLGADVTLQPMAREYIRPLMLITPFGMIGNFMAQFLVAEGKPKIQLFMTVGGGILNILLNYLLIVHFQMGLTGAALATGSSWLMQSVIALTFFIRNRKHGSIYFVRPKFRFKAIRHSCYNGVSEFIMMSSAAISSVVMNNILIRQIGPDGISSANIVFTVFNLLMSAIYGFSYGIAPLISFNLGAENYDRLKTMVRKGTMILIGVAIILTALGWIFTSQLVQIYVPRSTSVYGIASVAFRIVLISLLISAFNQFGITLFTSLNNGKVSGILAVMRTLVINIVFIISLSHLFGVDGVWWASLATEIVALSLTVFFFMRHRNRYKYI